MAGAWNEPDNYLVFCLGDCTEPPSILFEYWSKSKHPSTDVSLQGLEWRDSAWDTSTI